MKESENDRRDFFLKISRSVGLATFGGLVWSAYIDESKANKLILRPPASLKEEDFL